MNNKYDNLINSLDKKDIINYDLRKNIINL